MDKDFNENKRQKNCARQRRWYHKKQEITLNQERATNEEAPPENASLNVEEPAQYLLESNPLEQLSHKFNSEQVLYPKSSIK